MSAHDEISVRLTELQIQGVRTLVDVRFDLAGLIVLIGDNGSGKSSIIESIELLRRLVSREWISDIYNIHGGFGAIARHGSTEFNLALGGELVTPEGKSRLHYEVTVGRVEQRLAILGEELVRDNRSLFSRDDGAAWLLDSDEQGQTDMSGRFRPTESMLSALGEIEYPVVAALRDALTRIQIHVPFEVTAHWANAARQRQTQLRNTSVMQPAERLSRFGENLAPAYHELRNNRSNGVWSETLDYVRLGLGDHLEDVRLPADGATSGRIGLALKYRGLDELVPTLALSDGTLAYLALVAMVQLGLTSATPPSLLAFDEPDLHLHPMLTVRAVQLFERLAERCPVILATHNDRLLDALHDPAASVVLTSLDPATMSTQLLRPDPEQLEAWLERYRGLGELRTEVPESLVFGRKDEA